MDIVTLLAKVAAFAAILGVLSSLLLLGISYVDLVCKLDSTVRDIIDYGESLLNATTSNSSINNLEEQAKINEELQEILITIHRF